MSSARHNRSLGVSTNRDSRGEIQSVCAADPLMTVAEVGTFLRTSRKAIYAMIERGQLPGVIRINRRVLVDQCVLLDWLRQKSTPPSGR
jgi:predicted DNA-binding transcriptional regulator AlpA